MFDDEEQNQDETTPLPARLRFAYRLMGLDPDSDRQPGGSPSGATQRQGGTPEMRAIDGDQSRPRLQQEAQIPGKLSIGQRLMQRDATYAQRVNANPSGGIATGMAPPSPVIDGTRSWSVLQRKPQTPRKLGQRLMGLGAASGQRGNGGSGIAPKLTIGQRLMGVDGRGVRLANPRALPASVMGPADPFAARAGAPSRLGNAGPQSATLPQPATARAGGILKLRHTQVNPWPGVREQSTTGRAPAQTPVNRPQLPPGNNQQAVGYNQRLKERSYAPEGMRGHELIDDTLVQSEAYNLFKASMYGNDRREHSMWVVSQDGKYSFVRWPWSAETNKEIWRGPPPDGAVAVVHTHPTATGEKPSSGDRDLATGKQASNIRMPVYVLHKNGIWKADPGGGKDVHVRDYRWVDEFGQGGDFFTPRRENRTR